MAKKSDMLTIIVAIVLAGTLPEWVSGQNCGCPSNLCCSQWGYCGLGNDYCGPGCQEGPCYETVADIVTQEFWDRNIEPSSNCAGKGFYTREAFLGAASNFSRFGTVGSKDDNKREIAAFLAHAKYLSGRFCEIDEIRGATRNYCYPDNRLYPCNTGKHYHGRGPLQLKRNHNYGIAGNILGFDGLANPEILSTNNDLSFKASLWFWMVNCHNAIHSGLGFQATTDALETMENNGNPAAYARRVVYYRNFCSEFGVDPAGQYIYINKA